MHACTFNDHLWFLSHGISLYFTAEDNCSTENLWEAMMIIQICFDSNHCNDQQFSHDKSYMYILYVT